MMKQADRAAGGRTAAAAEPFIRLPGDPGCGCVVICDHATNALPEEYGTLGLPPEQLERHIGYDIGAADVARRLAGKLNAPAVLAGFSRLLIDVNRGEDDPTLIMRLSDRAVVPANADIGAAERERRLEGYYRPYHTAIDAAIDEGITAGRPPALVSIHSFTEAWQGRPRPWHATVLWDRDPRLPEALLKALQAEPGLSVGENVPYSGKLKGDCLYRHGTKRGLAHALIELRQDLVRDADGQEEWAGRLARIIGGLLSGPEAAELNRIHHYGSYADNGGGDVSAGGGGGRKELKTCPK